MSERAQEHINVGSGVAVGEGRQRARGAARWRLVAGGTIVGWLLLEIVLRIASGGARPGGKWDTASPVKESRWISHPFLPFGGRPNVDVVLKTGENRREEHVVTNSYGFRSHEFPPFPYEKKPEDFIVVCFGGSTTYGYAAASNSVTWPELLEAKLQERYPDRHVVVYNLGVDMATTAVSVVDMGLVGVHLEPDLVIVYHGFNDFNALGYVDFKTDHSHFYGDLDTAGMWSGVQARTPEWMLHSHVVRYVTGALDLYFGMNDLTRSVQKPRTPGADRFAGMDTTLRNLKTIGAMAGEDGGKALFSTFQFTEEEGVPDYQRFNQELRDYFEANDMMFVDQAALIPDRDPTINVDPCHFTPKGRQMLADNFYDYIVDHHLVE